MDKRIAVIGAGAIGGYTGGQLAHNGFDVTLIDPWPEHVEAIRREGLAIEGVTPGGIRPRPAKDDAPDRVAAPRQGKTDRHRDGRGQILRHRMGDPADRGNIWHPTAMSCRCRTA